MCGIVGAVADRDIVPMLIEGLRRLEYRGYDSAGVAVMNGTGHVSRLRTVGKVKMLQEALDESTRATATPASRTRAGPRTACRASATRIRISRKRRHRHRPQRHHREPRRAARGSCRREATSSPPRPTPKSSRTASTTTCRTWRPVQGRARHRGRTRRCLRARGADASREPDRLILARMGCPVVIGVGEHENFVASDVAALLPVTRRFQFLEEGDVAEVRRESVRIVDARGQQRRARRCG